MHDDTPAIIHCHRATCVIPFAQKFVGFEPAGPGIRMALRLLHAVHACTTREAHEPDRISMLCSLTSLVSALFCPCQVHEGQARLHTPWSGQCISVNLLMTS